MNKILKKVAEAQDSVKLVRENLPNTYEGFLSMSKLERDGIYKNIEFTIQTILDICAIIAKNEDLQVPNSDDDILNELHKSHILKGNIIEIVRQMKGFRNFLVHRYGALDDEIAYNNIKNGLPDFTKVFEEFKEVIS
ncbi:MAG: DUF86 domain-containing protein [Theionarchaea archaeon]|nr:DUF86 domain-containing protein [Theionarchaea archaeon]